MVGVTGFENFQNEDVEQVMFIRTLSTLRSSARLRFAAPHCGVIAQLESLPSPGMTMPSPISEPVLHVCCVSITMRVESRRSDGTLFPSAGSNIGELKE